MKNARKGSALLAVLWLSAALAAVAFSVATSVRGEIERTGTDEEDFRAQYLAQGGIARAILRVKWGTRSMTGDGANPYFVPGQPRFVFDFPTGQAIVEVVPEASKLSLNEARPEQFAALMAALGADPDRANTIAAAIADWRTAAAAPTGFDQFYLSQTPSFAARHASFQDVEELLLVAGMTPDFYYGTWVRTGEPSHLEHRGGVKDCVSAFGSTAQFDINSVQPAVLASAGVPGDAIEAIVARRGVAPFATMQDAVELGLSPEVLGHLAIGTHTLYTFRSTARMRLPGGKLSDLRRTVSALVKYRRDSNPDAQILRWYDRD